MQKVFSILFAVLILVSGIHLSLATHFCEGQLAAVKWSLSGEKATCGMEQPQATASAHEGLIPGCCHNVVSYFIVDQNYTTSSFQIKHVTRNVVHVFAVPVCSLLKLKVFSVFSFTNVSPPGQTNGNAVSLPGICVFRI